MAWDVLHFRARARNNAVVHARVGSRRSGWSWFAWLEEEDGRLKEHANNWI